MVAVVTLGNAAKASGGIAAAGLAGVALLAARERLRALGMLGALLLLPALLIAEIYDTSQFHSIRDRGAAAIVAGVVAIALLGVAARVFYDKPGWFALAAVAALPFRIPISAGGSTSNLLVPLYLVVAAGALAWAVPRLRDATRADPLTRPPLGLERLLVAAIVLYAVQATYSVDFSRALQNLVFFYVPFALLFVLLRETDWTPRLIAGCFGVLVALAIAFAGIGFVEYQARHLLLNPKVIDSNDFETYFRVNSLFFDPNIYGRFLALVMLAIMAALLWTTQRKWVLLGIAALAFLWGGLVLTFSQSSFSALLLGLAVLGALRWSPRRALALGVALALAGGAFVLISPGTVHLKLGNSNSLDAATSGRSALIRGGLDLFGSRPVWGYGSGGFPREYRKQKKASSERATSASHTIPITVLAEQGLIGLAVYLALLWFAFTRLFGGAARLGTPYRAYCAAAFSALVLHTMVYAAFLEDPLTWALLAVGTAFALPLRRVAAPEPASPEPAPADA